MSMPDLSASIPHAIRVRPGPLPSSRLDRRATLISHLRDELIESRLRGRLPVLGPAPEGRTRETRDEVVASLDTRLGHVVIAYRTDDGRHLRPRRLDVSLEDDQDATASLVTRGDPMTLDEAGHLDAAIETCRICTDAIAAAEDGERVEAGNHLESVLTGWGLLALQALDVASEPRSLHHAYAATPWSGSGLVLTTPSATMIRLPAEEVVAPPMTDGLALLQPMAGTIIMPVLSSLNPRPDPITTLRAIAAYREATA